MQTNPTILQYSRSLRTQMTQEERKLWYTFLKAYPQSFRRQFTKDDYILDFYCPKAKLAIELDGSQHYSEEGLAYDRRRTEYLSNKGILVLRFTNADINMRFHAVCEEIDRKVQGRI